MATFLVAVAWHGADIAQTYEINGWGALGRQEGIDPQRHGSSHNGKHPWNGREGAQMVHGEKNILGWSTLKHLVVVKDFLGPDVSYTKILVGACK